MDSQQESRILSERWRTLRMTTGSQALWSPVEEYMEYLIQELHIRLEQCSKEEVEAIQGEIKAYRAILELDSRVKKELQYIKTNK